MNANTLARRRLSRQVSAEVGRRSSPTTTARLNADRHHEHERADEVGAVHVGGVTTSCPPTSFTANTTNVANSTTRAGRPADAVDELVAEEADRTLNAEHDQHGGPERDAEQQREGLRRRTAPPVRPTRSTTSHCKAAGSTTHATERHAGVRAAAPVPVRGPHVDRYPTTSELSTVPITIASSPEPESEPEHDRNARR